MDLIMKIERADKKLIFVYNAQAGKINAVIDIAHKMLRPKTYQCKLCSLTHDVFVEKEQWRRFREQVQFPMEFLHRDEFRKKYLVQQEAYPMVLLLENQQLKKFISQEEMKNLKTTQELISLIRERMNS